MPSVSYKSPEAVKLFCDTCLISEPTSTERLSFLWLRWVHFAQTHPDVKHLWPDNVPRVSQLLSKGIKEFMPRIDSLRRAASIKQDGVLVKRGSIIITLQNLKFNKAARWPGYDDEWHPYPWVQHDTGIGRPSPLPDPRYQKYQNRKLMALGAAAKLKRLRRECAVNKNDWAYNYFLQKCDNILRDPKYLVEDYMFYITENMLNDVRKIIFDPDGCKSPNMIVYDAINKTLEHVIRNIGPQKVPVGLRDRAFEQENFDTWADPLAQSRAVALDEAWEMYWKYKDLYVEGTPEYNNLMRGLLAGRPTIKDKMGNEIAIEQLPPPRATLIDGTPVPEYKFPGDAPTDNEDAQYQPGDMADPEMDEMDEDGAPYHSPQEPDDLLW